MSEIIQTLVDRLFRERRNHYMVYIRRNLRNLQDAEDLFHEAYLCMRDALATTTILNPQAYLFTICRNLLRERARQVRREAGMADIDDPEVEELHATVPDFANKIDSERRAARVKEQLAQMPAKWQAAVKMCYELGMTYEEAASRLGVSVNSVKKYLKKALARCRRREMESG